MKTSLKNNGKISLGIFGNTAKEEVNVLLKKIVVYLKKNDIDFLIDEKLSSGIPGKWKNHLKPHSDILKASDYIVSLGGDGTFLNTARIVGDHNIPIAGINLGRLGFFSEVTLEETEDFFLKLLNGKFRVTEEVIIRSVTENGKTLFSMNDIVVDKNDSIRMLELETYYNNEKVVRIISDGIIVSTPAGSTGYSLSCNGPIVNPDSSVLIITPISPHTLNVRPIIVPDDGIIKIRILKESKIRITSDGQQSYKINSPAEVIVQKADYKIKVIKKLNSTYFNTLKRKLFWNADKRYN